MNLLSDLMNKTLISMQTICDVNNEDDNMLDEAIEAAKPTKKSRIRTITEWLYENQPATPEDVHRGTGIPYEAAKKTIDKMKYKDFQSDSKYKIQELHGRVVGTGETKLTTMGKPAELVKFSIKPPYCEAR